MAAERLEDFLRRHEAKELLRFITCGSVDDGKSTLIGRLLHDTQQILEDQLVAVTSDSRKWGTTGDAVDLALLVDGLQAEREQGITIDVAYRYFDTAARKYIIADCPGHEQYTRNMATGASTADLAVILVDAARGVQVQTRRHACIVSLLGIRHVIVAVNKMDLVGYDQQVFERIRAECLEVQGIRGVDARIVPVSALKGDNVVSRGDGMPWYTGPSIIEVLDTIDVSHDQQLADLRLPVQYVSRPDASFRGFAGTVAAGEIAVGDPVLAVPSRRLSRVREIVTFDGSLPRAGSAQAITVTLEDEIDISRGDLLVHPDRAPTVGRILDAHLIWMSDSPLLPGKQYEFKLSHRYVRGTVESIHHRIDVNDQSQHAATELRLNEVGLCRIVLTEQVAFDTYASCRATGAFIVVDRLNHATAGAGMILRSGAPEGAHHDVSVFWQPTRVTHEQRANQKAQHPCILWFTGLSGAGKSTVANAVEQALFLRGHHSYLLDGDNIRHGLNRDLDFSDAGRVENIRRIGEVAKLFLDAGLIVLTAFISPFRSDRRLVRDLVGDGEFVEVFVSTPIEECERRDPKGLYAKAREGAIRNFTGISSPYEAPEAAEIEIDSSRLSVAECVDRVIRYLEANGRLRN
ncbi:MAG: sulfate adenylyltransferase subunit CysN [Gammaproteobacteria bacterium]|nr:MAG: sulfate adenylyltransferase subunit CysN [Gammaproteobacteria bacterium]